MAKITTYCFSRSYSSTSSCSTGLHLLYMFCGMSKWCMFMEWVDYLQIIELQEAYQIHQSLLHGRSSTSSLHDIKAIVKTWRNRLPVISDDLSHWSDIFTWRQHHYQFVTQHYNNNQDQSSKQHSILGVHASAQV